MAITHNEVTQHSEIHIPWVAQRIPNPARKFFEDRYLLGRKLLSSNSNLGRTMHSPSI